MNIFDFSERKKRREPLTMVTCYDYCSAQILNKSPIDVLLVGDSVAMVMHGHRDTLAADVSMMALHVAAVTRGAPDKWVVGDLPFLAHRKGLPECMNAVEALMKAGAQSVKLEGAIGHTDLIKHIVQSGVPVMGHLGLTPQSLHQLGGFKVQGRDELQAENIFAQALQLEDAGVYALVLECVPSALAERITSRLQIPTIGIGAGRAVDGQVLVLQDLLGLQNNFKPRFVRHFAQGSEWMSAAIHDYIASVKSGNYPSDSESYQ